MPFRIDKTKNGLYALYNLHKKEYTKVPFKTKEGAINMGKQYIWFSEKKRSIVKRGRWILPTD